MPDAAEPTIPPSQPSPGLKVATLGGVPVYIGRTWPVIAIIIVAPSARRSAAAGPTSASGPTSWRPRSRSSCWSRSSPTRRPTPWSRPASATASTGWWPTSGAATRRTTRQQSRPGPSALVAVLGPAANGAIALAGWLLADRVPGGVPALLVGAVVWTNAFVALFNLLPGPAAGRRLPRRRPRLAGHRQPRPRPHRRRMVRSRRHRARAGLGAAAAVPAGLPALPVHRRLGRRHRRLPLDRRDQRHPHRPHPRRAGRDPHRLRMAPCQLAAGRQHRRRRLGPAGQRARRRGVVVLGATARRRAWSTTTPCWASPRRPAPSPRSWPWSAGSPPGGSSTPTPTPRHPRGRDDADAAGRRGTGATALRPGRGRSSWPATSRQRCHEGPPRAPRLARHE